MRIGDIRVFEFDGRRGTVEMYDASSKIVRWDDGRMGGGPTNVDEMIAAGRLVVIEMAPAAGIASLPMDW